MPPPPSTPTTAAEVTAPFAGRERDIAAGGRVLANGGSVLVTGPVGVGTDAVARALLDRCGADHDTAVVVGSDELRDHPLAAVGVAGLLPTMGGSADPGQAVGRALTALAVRQGGAPLVVLVEAPHQLDPFSGALLGEGVRRSVLQLIVPATNGLPLGALAASRDTGLLTRLEVQPMNPGELAGLAAGRASSLDVERAVAAADGNPPWFEAMLSCRWFAGAPPVPPRMREIADGVLATLPRPVLDVLLVASVAGVAPIEILVTATSTQAVQAALDAQLLTSNQGLARVRHRLLRARLAERARVRMSLLTDRIGRATAETGLPLPLSHDGRPPDAGTLAGLAAVVPAEVAAHLDASADSLPPGTRLVHARTLLAVGRVSDATVVLRGLASSVGTTGATEEEVIAEAAMVLAYIQAHDHGDLAGATETIERAMTRIESPDLRIRLGARQVTVEAFGPQRGDDDRLVGWEREALSPRTELEVAKARSLVEWGSRARVPAGLDSRLMRLLGEVGAAPGERWATLAAVFWGTVFADGMPGAWDMAEEEIRLARSRGDMGAAGSWYSLQAGALTVGGQSRAAAALGARADAALVGHDGFGVRPIALAFTALALHRCGRDEEAREALSRSRGLAAQGSILTHAVAAVADLALNAAATNAPDSWARTEEIFDQLGRPMLVWSAWRGAQPPSGEPVTLSAQARSDRGVDGQLQEIESADPSDAHAAARDLIGRGHYALALAGLRRRDVVVSDDAGASRLQHQHLRALLAGMVEPGLSAPTTADVVSARQLEIAVRAAAGDADRAIADELSLSVRTVSNHLSRLYRATGVADRQELADILRPVHLWRPVSV